MDVVVDAAQDTNMLVVLSVPELDSEQSFQTRFLRGKSKTSLTLNINEVTWPVWRPRKVQVCYPPSGVTLGSVLHQTSSVRLWWPNGHGAQPGYHLAVAGLQGRSLMLKTETKVRETASRTSSDLCPNVAGRFRCCWTSHNVLKH